MLHSPGVSFVVLKSSGNPWFQLCMSRAMSHFTCGCRLVLPVVGQTPTSFFTLLALTRGEFCGLLARSSFGLLEESLLTPCILGVQVLGSCVCFVLLLVTQPLFGMCCLYKICQLVFPHRVFMLMDTPPLVKASGSLSCIQCCCLFVWM